MMEWLENTKSALFNGMTLIGGALVGLIGGWDVSMKVLVTMVALDYITGVSLGWIGKSPKTENGGVSSSVGLHGLLKKCAVFMVIIVATLLDSILEGDAALFRTAAAWFYIANEGISLLENISLLGVPVPQKILDALENLKSKNTSNKE